MPIAQVNGVDLAYEIAGTGESLLLIQGLGAGKGAWFRQVPAFKARYRVITFDNRGVGETRAGDQPYSVRTMADDAVALLDLLGIASAHVLGLSLGGFVAQELAISHPERVRKLILASTAAIGPEPMSSTSGVERALGVKPGAVALHAEGFDPRRVMPALIDLSFNKGPYRALLKLLAMASPTRASAPGVAGQLRAATSVNTLDRLDRIQAPTLVMTGSGDRVIDPAASRVLASRIPNARLLVIEGASHAFGIEMSVQFNKAVLDFLADP